MKHDLIVTASIDIAADLSRVWEVLTNPEIIKEYLFGTQTITDWKVGSEIVFQGEYEGRKYRDHGVIRENVFHKLISWTYWTGFSGLEDKPDNYSLVSWRLNPKGNNLVTLTWTQKGFASEEGQKHSQSGMKAFLEQVKDIAEP